jgi:hypothetical protein
MSRPRAADDFTAIRARMHELRRENLTRPRAADDFTTIRIRIDELRREHRGLSCTGIRISERRAAAVADTNSLRWRMIGKRWRRKSVARV